MMHGISADSWSQGPGKWDSYRSGSHRIGTAT